MTLAGKGGGAARSQLMSAMKGAGMFRVATLSFLVALTAACDGASDAPNCTAIDASACGTPIPSFATDVTPVLDRACNSTCHAPGVGPWPLVNYNDVSDWATIIQADIAKCSMPPADAGAGNGSLTDSERAMLLNWLACGAPNN